MTETPLCPLLSPSSCEAGDEALEKEGKSFGEVDDPGGGNGDDIDPEACEEGSGDVLEAFVEEDGGKGNIGFVSYIRVPDDRFPEYVKY